MRRIVCGCIGVAGVALVFHEASAAWAIIKPVGLLAIGLSIAFVGIWGTIFPKDETELPGEGGT